MLTISKAEISAILSEFAICGQLLQTQELLRYNYDSDKQDSKRVRLIVKVSFQDRPPVVVKIKSESGVTREILESQTAFSEHLASCGVPVARYFSWLEGYVMSKELGGYDVLITVETFQDGEIKTVDPSIAERDGCHVPAPVLFNPFARNELFSFECFQEFGPHFQGEDAVRFARICDTYRRRMELLVPLRSRPQYAVQGDISDCNLFLTPDGRVGMFDFNNCGDSILLCDAVMQGVFEARLMDYGHPLTEAYSNELFEHFMKGYQMERPLSAEERKWSSHLCAVISAFSLMDMIYQKNSLKNCIEAGDRGGVSVMLRAIEERIQI